MTELRETEPELPVARLDAAGAFGFESAEGDARISIYVFRDSSLAAGAAAHAAQLLDAEGGEVMSATNGRMAFVGRTVGPDAASRAAHYRLAQLLSAFSGDE